MGLKTAALTAATVVAVATGPHYAPDAEAEPVAMAPQVYDKVTPYGWHLDMKIHDETVNSVPNLAAAANSREAFVTATVTATATGGGSPISDSLFILGYQLGRQSDVSAGLVMGGTGRIAGSVSVRLGCSRCSSSRARAQSSRRPP
ncbi:hypothetical protein EUA04_14865 [Mycolicibacterium obuense]|uniref:Porin MspA n=1 Tax=Mycolicibacterium obuense TaxID=1807 RepID=A0A4R5X4T5_9MYCO|nr:hypothetical protein EUA04_14865 [Mycolicibacterium obuense]